jgi:hypothetical protein
MFDIRGDELCVSLVLLLRPARTFCVPECEEPKDHSCITITCQIRTPDPHVSPTLNHYFITTISQPHYPCIRSKKLNGKIAKRQALSLLGVSNRNDLLTMYSKSSRSCSM